MADRLWQKFSGSSFLLKATAWCAFHILGREQFWERYQWPLRPHKGINSRKGINSTFKELAPYTNKRKTPIWATQQLWNLTQSRVSMSVHYKATRSSYLELVCEPADDIRWPPDLQRPCPAKISHDWHSQHSLLSSQKLCVTPNTWLCTPTFFFFF